MTKNPNFGKCPKMVKFLKTPNIRAKKQSFTKRNLKRYNYFFQLVFADLKLQIDPKRKTVKELRLLNLIYFENQNNHKLKTKKTR